MPRTKKTLELQNLRKYDVYIEDRTETSDYFQVSNLPSQFTGGKNSFLINASEFLQDKSTILIEILDYNGNPIYHRIVPNYTEAKAKLISVEIYNTTPSGIATIILMGKAISTTNGVSIPPEWQNTYNVRWVKNVFVNPLAINSSPIRFLTTPQVTAQENRFESALTSSYVTSRVPFTASLLPILYSSIQNGYTIEAVAPATFSGYHFTGKLTGSLSINGRSVSVNLPITNILNKTKAFSTGYLVQSPLSSGILKSIYVTSGSYTSSIYGSNYGVTSSVLLEYSTLESARTKVPTSYANIRVTNMSTVSGEIYKVRVYGRAARSNANFKIIGDIPVNTEELLYTSSLVGNLPIGDVFAVPSASENWYAGQLEVNLQSTAPIFPYSGSAAYYSSSVLTGQFSISSSSDTLLNSIYAGVPIDVSTNKFIGLVSQSGYFIGNTRPVILFPSSEYTLEFDAYYSSYSSSVVLSGNSPRVDIYLIGDSVTPIISKNPLGQKIGELTKNSDARWIQKKQFNFTPAIKSSGNVSIRFVISNGFWYFSNVSLKPASDFRFGPDEVQFLVPNTEYFNDAIEYRIEFFDINNNSANISATATPTFFTGSGIDLGTLP